MGGGGEQNVSSTVSVGLISWVVAVGGVVVVTVDGVVVVIIDYVVVDVIVGGVVVLTVDAMLVVIVNDTIFVPAFVVAV